jgi:hypothetical protein
MTKTLSVNSLPTRPLNATTIVTMLTTALAACVAMQACSDQSSQKSTAVAVVPSAKAVDVADVADVSILSLGVPDSVSGLPFAVGGKCSLDAINGERVTPAVTVASGKPFDVYGWAFDDSNSALAVPAIALIQLVKDGKYYHATLKRNADRPDVAKVFSDSSLVASGLFASVSPVGLAPGDYEVLIMQRAGDKNLVCPTYRMIKIST